MFTTEVRHGESVTVIRRETRGTALKRSRYLRYVAEGREEYKQLSTYGNMVMFSIQSAAGSISVEEGTAFRTLSDFVTALSQIVRTDEHAPVLLKHEAEYLPKDKVLEAFDAYVNDESGWWDTLIDAIYELGAPATPKEQQPPESLTKDDKNDPN